MKHAILILFVFSLQTVYSQFYSIGSQYGIGRGYIHSHYNFNSFFDKDAFTNLSISLLCDYKPEKPIFKYVSSITYDFYTKTDYTISFMKLPIGVDFQIGKINSFLFGCGLFGQVFLFRTGKFYLDFTRFQIGGYYNIGFKYQIDDNHNFICKITKGTSSDLYSTQYNPHSIPGGGWVETYLLKNIGINIGFTHKLEKKKK